MNRHPALDLADPILAARLQGRNLAIAASAGSGKTFSLVALVLGFLGRPENRAHQVLATTFSRESASDLKARILRPLDELAALDEGAWSALLPALHQNWEAWDGAVEGLGLRGETRVAARQWPCNDEWPAWTLSPAKARLHWIRTRREAEHLDAGTVHGLALRLVQDRFRGEGESTRELLDVVDPRLVGLLRRSGRQELLLPAEHPDHLPARRLLGWLEGREGGRERWERVAAALDAHADALGEWRQQDGLEDVRESFWGQARAGLEAHRPFAAEPDRAAGLKKDGGVMANFEKHGRPRFRPAPGAEVSEQALLRFWEDWFRDFPKADGELPNYYADSYGEALAESCAALPELLEFWLTLLVERVLRRFENEKEKRGWRTFGDLVREALRALQARPLEPAPQLLLVDEHQDINPAQEALLNALGAQAVVVVGDRKQAIYGFRGGVADLLDARLAEAATRGDAYRLPANHRSTAPVVALANAFVGEVMPLLEPEAADADGQQEPVARGAGMPLVALLRVDSERPLGADLPAAAAWITALSHEAGWAAFSGAWPAEPPRQRALLLPRRNGLPTLRRLLQSRGVEPMVVSQDGFWDSPGVRWMMALLECLARPDRALPFLTVLRSPWFGAADPELLAAAPALAKGWRGLEPADGSSRIREAVDWLRDLAGRSTLAVVAQALTRPGLLEAMPALQAHGRMEPDRARRNLDRFVTLCSGLSAHPPSAFAALARKRQRPEGDAPPGSSEGPSALLIQTIHTAKGLEYEDVLLPMLNYPVKGTPKGQLGRVGGSRHLALGWKLGQVRGPLLKAMADQDERRMRREGLNLLYVGLTRAKERLALLQQWTVKDGVAEDPPTASQRVGEGKAANWQHVAAELSTLMPGMLRLAMPPGLLAPEAPGVADIVAAPAGFDGIQASPAFPDLESPEREGRRKEGIAMHTLLRECLMRAATDPEAVAIHLSRSPLAAQWPGAESRVQAFLRALGAKGWGDLPRRTEFPLAGAGVDGGMGFADLVIWEADRRVPYRIHLVDFKLASAPDARSLEAFGLQLQGYARALRALHPQAAVEAHLWSLEARDWIATPGA